MVHEGRSKKAPPLRALRGQNPGLLLRLGEQLKESDVTAELRELPAQSIACAGGSLHFFRISVVNLAQALYNNINKSRQNGPGAMISLLGG